MRAIDFIIEREREREREKSRRHIKRYTHIYIDVSWDTVLRRTTSPTTRVRTLTVCVLPDLMTVIPQSSFFALKSPVFKFVSNKQTNQHNALFIKYAYDIKNNVYNNNIRQREYV